MKGSNDCTYLMITDPYSMFTFTGENVVSKANCILRRSGNIPQLGETGGMYQFLRDLHTECGPVAEYCEGATLVVSTSSPVAFKPQIGVFNKPGTEDTSINSHLYKILILYRKYCIINVIGFIFFKVVMLLLFC